MKLKWHFIFVARERICVRLPHSILLGLWEGSCYFWTQQLCPWALAGEPELFKRRVGHKFAAGLSLNVACHRLTHLSRNIAARQLTSVRPCGGGGLRARVSTVQLCGTFSNEIAGVWAPTPMSLLHVRRHRHGTVNLIEPSREINYRRHDQRSIDQRAPNWRRGQHTCVAGMPHHLQLTHRALPAYLCDLAPAGHCARGLGRSPPSVKVNAAPLPIDTSA